jgi:hypothetical protein
VETLISIVNVVRVMQWSWDFSLFNSQLDAIVLIVVWTLPGSLLLALEWLAVRLVLRRRRLQRAALSQAGLPVPADSDRLTAAALLPAHSAALASPTSSLASSSLRHSASSARLLTPANEPASPLSGREVELLSPRLTTSGGSSDGDSSSSGTRGDSKSSGSDREPMVEAKQSAADPLPVLVRVLNAGGAGVGAASAGSSSSATAAAAASSSCSDEPDDPLHALLFLSLSYALHCSLLAVVLFLFLQYPHCVFLPGVMRVPFLDAALWTQRFRAMGAVILFAPLVLLLSLAHRRYADWVFRRARFTGEHFRGHASLVGRPRAQSDPRSDWDAGADEAAAGVDASSPDGNKADVAVLLARLRHPRRPEAQPTRDSGASPGQHGSFQRLPESAGAAP